MTVLGNSANVIKQTPKFITAILKFPLKDQNRQVKYFRKIQFKSIIVTMAT